MDMPLMESQPPAVGDVEMAIGEYCASLIEDGSTLQLGIGAIPDAVLASLKNHKHLGIHSEMIADGVLDLVEAGVIDCSEKTLHKGQIVVTFLMGTKRLYDFADRNPMLMLRPVDYVNDPSQGYEYSLTVDDSWSTIETTTIELVGTEMTIAEAATQANYGRLVTLKDVEIQSIGNGLNKLLTDGENNTIKARDLFGILPENYQWPEKASSITGVVLYYMTGWFLMPISEDAIVAASGTGINIVNAANADNVNIYNLQGVRLNQLQRGLNIVNGRKVMMK